MEDKILITEFNIEPIEHKIIKNKRKFEQIKNDDEKEVKEILGPDPKKKPKSNF